MRTWDLIMARYRRQSRFFFFFIARRQKFEPSLQPAAHRGCMSHPQRDAPVAQPRRRPRLASLPLVLSGRLASRRLGERRLGQKVSLWPVATRLPGARHALLDRQSARQVGDGRRLDAAVAVHPGRAQYIDL